MKKLSVDGERKVIRPTPSNSACNNMFTVAAIREDSDTPCVEITLKDMDGMSVTAWLTDVDAEELSRQIQKAISILPSSK